MQIKSYKEGEKSELSEIINEEFDISSLDDEAQKMFSLLKLFEIKNTQKVNFLW